MGIFLDFDHELDILEIPNHHIMPTIYKWQVAYTLEEARTRAKIHNRERAAEIPALLQKKGNEYV